MNAGATTYTPFIGHNSSANRRSTAIKSPGHRKAEGALIARLRSGEKRAFDELVVQQHGALIRMAMGYVADRAAAEEVAQETWIAVMKGLNRFEGRSSLRAWICAILIHKAKDRGIREKRHATFSDFGFEHEDYHGAIDPFRLRPSKEWTKHSAFSLNLWDDRTPENLLALKQAMACMQKSIEALPPLLKEVLILRDAHGVETKEVCARLNISETNLYVRLHRAREQVRTAVETALG